MTIIPSDSVVSIDGSVKQVDLSAMDPTIHAVQWYESWGEIEHKNPATGRMTGNEEFTDVARFQSVIDAWSAMPDLPPPAPAPAPEPDPLVTLKQV